MTNGRLHISFDRARHVVYRDGSQMTHFPWVFAEIKLGATGKKPITYRTKAAKNVKCDKLGEFVVPIFHHEHASYDLIQKVNANLISEEDSTFTLEIELWEERMPIFPLACDCNRLLGRTTIDLTPVLSNPFRPIDDYFTFSDCSDKYTDRGGKPAIRLNLLYEAGRHGLLVATLIEGKNLADRAGFIGWLSGDKQDPYVMFEFGGNKVKSKVCNDGGVAPNFFNERLVLWSGTTGKRNDMEMWQNPLKVTLYDDNFGKDAVIGSADLDLLQYFSIDPEESNKMRSIDLARKGVEAGELVYKLDFVPAGTLTAWIKGGRNLRSTELIGKQDPYVVLTLSESIGGESAARRVKTKTHKDGGITPIWNESFCFDIVDQYELKIECFDEDFGKDDLIGETTYSLMECFKSGFISCNVPISYGKTVDTKKPAGELIFVFHFDPSPIDGTPTNFRYPAYVPEIETYLPPKVAKTFSGVGAMPPEKTWANPGRLIVTCIEVDDVHGKDSDLQAYVTFKVGRETNKKSKTKTQKSDETGHDVVFNETLIFDIADPNEIKQDDDIELEMEVFDDNWKDQLLCHNVYSLKKNFSDFANETKDFWLDLKVAGDDDLNGRIHLSVRFEPAKTGMFKIALNSATGLQDGGFMDTDKNDPYVLAELESGNKSRCITNDDAGVKADFKNEELLLWCGSGKWINPLKFKVFDDNTMKDSLLGQCEVSTTKIMGGALPFLSINCRVSFNGVDAAKIGEQEDKCITRAIGELLDEPEDDVEDLKSHERPAQEDGRRGGTDITFSLRKQLLKGMYWETWQDRENCAKKLWPDRKKVHESVDPKPVALLRRFEFIIKGGDVGAKNVALLHSLHGKIQSVGAQMQLLNLANLTVDCDYYHKPEISTTLMQSYDLLTSKGKEQKTDPELHMNLEFIPAGLLVVQVKEAKDMRSTEWIGKNDPYVICSMESLASNKVGNAELRGKTIKSGGKDCKFDEEFNFDVVDQKVLKLQIWDDDMGKDDLIGEMEIDLLQVYKRGVVDKWFDLSFDKPLGCCSCSCCCSLCKKKAAEAKIADFEGDAPVATSASSVVLVKDHTLKIKAGEVRIVLTFFGEEGVFYPARVGPEDEIMRAKLQHIHAEEHAAVKKQFEDKKEEMRLELMANEGFTLQKLAEAREKEDIALIAEFELKKMEAEKFIRFTHKKNREEEEGWGELEAGANTFEMLSPLAQEQFTAQAELDLQKDLDEKKAEIIEMRESKKVEVARKRVADDEKAGGNQLETIVANALLEIDVGLQDEETKLKTKQYEEIAGAQYDEAERINVLESTKKDIKRRSTRKVRATTKKTMNELALKDVLEELAIEETALVALEADSASAGDDSSVASHQRGRFQLPVLNYVPEMPTLPELPTGITEEDDAEMERIQREHEEKVEAAIEREKMIVATAPTSLDFELLDGILGEVQNETQSRKEEYEQMLRELFAMWYSILNKVRWLNRMVDDSRTVVAYEGYLKDREIAFKECKQVKKVYLKKMTELKESAMESEDFGIVHIASREIADTNDRTKVRLYRTYREHMIYHTLRYIKLVLQFIIAWIWATVAYIPFIGLFCLGFVCSSDIDVTDDKWYGEDLEACVSSAACPVLVTGGYFGYVLDMRGYLFGREGEKKHWIWRKVFRPRDFDEKVMEQLWATSNRHEAEDVQAEEERDKGRSILEMQEEAKGGVDKFANGVTDNKDNVAVKSRKVQEKKDLK